MGLVVGELVAFIRADDSGMDPGLRAAEGNMRRTGEHMADDADQAGERAGQAMGEGLTTGVQTRLATLPGIVRKVAGQAGQQGGQALGDGLTDGAADGADQATTAAEGKFGRLKMAAAGVGVAAGAALMAGMTETLSQGQIIGKLRAQLGATPAEAQRYGKLAGQLFAQGVTVDFQTAADTIRAVIKGGLAPPDATNAQLQSIATKASDVATTFDEELGGVTNAVAQLMRTGLAQSSTEAFDIISAGLNSNADKADDFLDTINEYSTQFRRVGLDGQTATGLLSQGLKAGARDADQVADAIGQFGERALAGGKPVEEAFKSIGLNADTMAKQIGKGGSSAEAALGLTMKRLRGTSDEQVKLNAAAALFGDPGNVMGKALFALDPATAAASSGMDKAKGATDALGKGLRDNAGANVTRLKNTLSQGLVNVIGGSVIPALAKFGTWAKENGGTLKVLAGVVASVLVPALILMGVNAVVAGAKVAAGWTMAGAAALRALPGQIAAAARVVGGWVLMGVQSLIQAGRMAAAWLIAMGPVGWVIAAIVGLGLLIWANWDKIKVWTAEAWDWIWNKIKAVGQMLLDLFLNFTLYGLIIQHWDSIKQGTAAAWDWVWGKIKGIGVSIVTTVSGFVGSALKTWDRLKAGVILKIAQLVVWVQGLPGRIKKAVGDLGSLLYNKGRDIVSGIWDGIRGMGPWLAGKLAGFAKSAIPGPIARALGIASPSKVMRDQIGRHIPAGLIAGIEAGAPALDRTMAGLVTPPAVGAMGGGGGASSGYGSRNANRTVIEIRSGGSKTEDMLLDLMRHAIQVRGRDAQVVLVGRN